MMLSCCNNLFSGLFRRVVKNSNSEYRRIEFGICPKCGAYCFMDYRSDNNGNEKIKILRGRKAQTKFKCWEDRFKNQKQGNYSNQNVYYGDFKKTDETDSNGYPVYVQLRRNFNGQTEVLNKITTTYKALI